MRISDNNLKVFLEGDLEAAKSLDLSAPAILGKIVMYFIRLNIS